MIFVNVFCCRLFVGRMCKPPNRKKHEEDVAQCNITIESKEKQLVSITVLMSIRTVSI